MVTRDMIERYDIRNEALFADRFCQGWKGSGELGIRRKAALYREAAGRCRMVSEEERREGSGLMIDKMS